MEGGGEGGAGGTKVGGEGGSEDGPLPLSSPVLIWRGAREAKGGPEPPAHPIRHPLPLPLLSSTEGPSMRPLRQAGEAKSVNTGSVLQVRGPRVRMDKERGSSRAGGQRALRSRSLSGEEKALGSGKPHVSPAPLSPWGPPPPVLPPRKSPAQPGMG